MVAIAWEIGCGLGLDGKKEREKRNDEEMNLFRKFGEVTFKALVPKPIYILSFG